MENQAITPEDNSTPVVEPKLKLNLKAIKKLGFTVKKTVKDNRGIIGFYAGSLLGLVGAIALAEVLGAEAQRLEDELPVNKFLRSMGPVDCQAGRFTYEDGTSYKTLLIVESGGMPELPEDLTIHKKEY